MNTAVRLWWTSVAIKDHAPGESVVIIWSYLFNLCFARNIPSDIQKLFSKLQNNNMENLQGVVIHITNQISCCSWHVHSVVN